MGPFTPSNIAEIFGEDSADLEEQSRLWAFFVSSDAYEEMRAAGPVALVVGQRGIGKTALMRVAAFEDQRSNVPNILMPGSRILGAAELQATGSQSIIGFRAVIEDAIVASVAERLARESASEIGIPDKAGSVLGTLARLGASIATGSNDKLKTAAAKLTPWLLEKVKECNVYIDDTDVEWDGSPLAADRINRLIQACFQLAAESHGDLRFRISIRSDLHNYLAVTSDVIGKIQSSIVRFRWTNDQIFRILAKRIAVFGDVFIEDGELEEMTQESLFQRFFAPYFEDRYHGKGAWENQPMRKVVLSFVRQRPRDLVGFCRLAAREAERRGTKIDTASIDSMLKQYCDLRLNDTVVEFRTELPEVEKLLYEMRSTAKQAKQRKSGQIPGSVKSNYYTNDQLISKLRDISQRVNLRFSYARSNASMTELAEFLFRLNFIVASKTDEEGHIDRLYYDFADQKLRDIRLGRWDWEVHMAYRWAIEQDADAIWKELTP